MPFSFSFFLFPIFLFSFFVFPLFFCRSPCSPSLFLFRSFCPFFLSFSVFRLFLYRLLRFSFRFLAFLGGGFCYSVISSRRYTPPALLASLKYAYSPCVLSFLALLMLSYFIFCSFPSLFRFFRYRFGHRLFHPVFFLWVLCRLFGFGFGFCRDLFSYLDTYAR